MTGASRRGNTVSPPRYKNHNAYLAVAPDVERIPDEARLIVHRAVTAIGSGEAVNPDRVEGGIVRSISWSAFEVGLSRRRAAHRP